MNLFPGLKTVGKFLKNPIGMTNRDVKKIIKKPGAPFKSANNTMGRIFGSKARQKAGSMSSSGNTGVAGSTNNRVDPDAGY